MSDPDPIDGPDGVRDVPPSTLARVGVLVFAALMALGVMLAIVFRPQPGPAPAEIAGDPFLVQGRELYLGRCVTCHGPNGLGDGPIADTLKPTKPGNLADGRWQHGDRPEQVLGVVAHGVPGAAMAGWSSAFSDEDLRAVTAYVYVLARQPVPEALRTAGAVQPVAPTGPKP